MRQSIDSQKLGIDGIHLVHVADLHALELTYPTGACTARERADALHLGYGAVGAEDGWNGAIERIDEERDPVPAAIQFERLGGCIGGIPLDGCRVAAVMCIDREGNGWNRAEDHRMVDAGGCIPDAERQRLAFVLGFAIDGEIGEGGVELGIIDRICLAYQLVTSEGAQDGIGVGEQLVVLQHLSGHGHRLGAYLNEVVSPLRQLAHDGGRDEQRLVDAAFADQIDDGLVLADCSAGAESEQERTCLERLEPI